VNSVDLFITEDGVSQRRAAGLAPNGSWTYYTPISTKKTAFRLVALASNGTSTSSLPDTSPYSALYEGTY
jgi:hypothetical protein